MMQHNLIEEKYNIQKIRKLMSSLYSVILWYDDRKELPEDWIDYAYKPLMLLLKELKINTENAKLLKKTKVVENETKSNYSSAKDYR